MPLRCQMKLKPVQMPISANVMQAAMGVGQCDFHVERCLFHHVHSIKGEHGHCQINVQPYNVWRCEGVACKGVTP